ncbi:hypothetical protein Hanom_Chr02g00130491 [Helianthus anomalus]
MDGDYDMALGELHRHLPDLDIGGFANRDTAPPKTQKTLASAVFCRIAQNIG